MIFGDDKRPIYVGTKAAPAPVKPPTNQEPVPKHQMTAHDIADYMSGLFKLRTHFLDYPACKEDEETNQKVMKASLTQLVDEILAQAGWLKAAAGTKAKDQQLQYIEDLDATDVSLQYTADLGEIDPELAQEEWIQPTDWQSMEAALAQLRRRQDKQAALLRRIMRHSES